MPYMHKSKWGAVDALSKKTLVIDPHLFSAPVGTIRVGEKGERELMFWRTKTRCSSHAEWMELHDAQDGACLWRAEARYADRGAPVRSVDASGREKTEFLTVLRLYLEAETTPRLMVVHRDTQPMGLRSKGSKSLAVYMLDPGQQKQYVPPTPIGGGSNAAATDDAPSNSAGAKPVEPEREHFDFASLPAGEDIFQITLNSSLTTISLAALRLPPADELEAGASSKRGVKVSKGDVRTLARYKLTHEALKRKVEIDGGLDLPLVTMLLCSVDQLLLSHEAIDYDVAWPSDYGFSQLECLSSRKKEAESLKATAEFGLQTGESGERSKASDRLCFCF